MEHLAYRVGENSAAEYLLGHQVIAKYPYGAYWTQNPET